MKVSTEIDNNFGYEKITQLVDNKYPFKQWVYLVFKENIKIATLLKRGNTNVDIKFSAHERFWNNLPQVAQNQKIGKPNNLIVLGA